MKELPEGFLSRVRTALANENEYQKFIYCFEKPPFRGLNFNLLKAREETVRKLVSEWNLKKVPWSPTGWYYNEADGVFPGKSPYHDAGVYYIQEPSAMAVAEQAGIEAGHRVLDLCAAPGGKSSRAAVLCRGAMQQPQGFLVSNEIIRKRARILSSNMERLGFDNCIVTSAAPAELSGCLPSFFDRIIVDAPCSGEGMMRRDDIAVSEWSEANVIQCIGRQKQILDEAWKMLAPGGRLVYSTCTFEYGENAGMAEDFVLTHGDAVCTASHQLWPQEEDGEGHFYAVFEKAGAEERRDSRSMEETALFLKKKHIHVLRCGIEKGETLTGAHDRKTRYEPSHAEAMAITPGCGRESSCIPGYVETEDIAQAEAFLAGREIRLSSDCAEAAAGNAGDGFVRVLYDGYPLGLGKKKGNLIKNHLPKGLRNP